MGAVKVCAREGCTNKATRAGGICNTHYRAENAVETPLRECAGCGHQLRSFNRLCPQCRATERQCTSCGRTYKGNHLRCKTCQGREERTCLACERTFKGTNRLCGSCVRAERTCVECARTFKGTSPTCLPCYRRQDPERARAQYVKDNRARAARKAGVQVAGPLPVAVYLAIRAEGSCVYCGAPAQEVDHILPLARGGWEVEANLVPACQPCNGSKHERLLIEWDAARVARAVEVSEKVAAEYALQTSGATRAPLVPLAVSAAPTPEVRAWAQSVGVPIAPRGPIPTRVRAAYLQETGR